MLHPAELGLYLVTMQARIGDEGAVVISQHLPLLPFLEMLDMSLNVIGDDGIEALSLAFGHLSCLQV